VATTVIDRPRAVIVEGADYLHFLIHAYRNDPFFKTAKVYDSGGVTDLERFLSAFRLAPGFGQLTSLGIIRDAEGDAGAAERAVKRALANNGFDVPPSPNIITTGPLKTGFLIVPHGEVSGCLEDACLSASLVPAIKTCAEAFLDCVGRDPNNRNWDTKVTAHAMIAASKTPGATLGQSTLLSLWDKQHPAIKVIEDFITRLP
jgi:hypothetical protein